MVKVVLFDFDGPLANSLMPHINFCRRMSEKHSLGLALPMPDNLPACRQIVGFPMEKFLLNAGFPAELMPQLLKDYTAEFGRQGSPPPLQMNTKEVLTQLKDAGYRLGIVSLNYRRSIEICLNNNGDGLFKYFDLIFGLEDFKDKVSGLKAAFERLDVTPQEVVYVGDAYHDQQAAKEVGCWFIGVNYGWQITGMETDMIIINSLLHLFEWIRLI